MDSMRKVLALLIVAVLLCALASPVPAGLAAILTPLFLFGVVLATLTRLRVFEACGMPAAAFARPAASRAPPLA